MAQGLRDVAALPDPVGEVLRGYTQPNGLEIRQIRVPFGVIAMIYEARPNVTVDAAGLAAQERQRRPAARLRQRVPLEHRAGRGPRPARRRRPDCRATPWRRCRAPTAAASTTCCAPAASSTSSSRAAAPGSINHVVEHATVPVIETGVGNVHVYVDAAADLDVAERIVVNSKTSRVSVCNSAETLLVHRDVADEFLPRITSALQTQGVVLHGDDAFAAYDDVQAATDDDWAREYLSLDMAARVVDDLDEAVAHIRRWSSGHTEAIVTRDLAAARRFVARVDSAAVMVNASTRFTDGGEFGFGAEIGISTQKLHARGPMGLGELTSTKWVVTGDGHVR